MPAAGALGGSGDIQRPPGVAAEMAIGEFWPSISENDIQRVVDEHRAAEQRFSDYGDTLKRKRSESPNLLQGQAGDARVERLTEMMNHAYAVADHLGSKVVTAESYRSTVVGLKLSLTQIGDAAQKAWETAQQTKTPFDVSPFKAEALVAQSTALGDIAAAPPPTPMPGEDSPRNGTQAEPASNEAEKDRPREPGKGAPDENQNEDAAEPSAATDEERTPGTGDSTAGSSDEFAGPGHQGEGTDALRSPHNGLTEQPTMSTAPRGVGLPTTGMPNAAAGSGVGSGMGSLRPPQMPSGLNTLSGNSLKDAATVPASSVSEALSSNPLTNPNLSSAASSFQSGLASGMGASGAVSATPPPALEKFAGPNPSAAVSPGGGQVPVVPAQGASAAPAPAAPGGPAPVGGGGGGMAPAPGGGGLMPYVPPGGGPAPPAPGGATLPTSAQPVQSPGASAQQSAGGPPVVASSSGSGAAAGAVAASEPEPSAELVLARRILDGLVRGTEFRDDLLNSGFVQWAVSVLELPTGQLVAIASTVGDGGYVPPGVVIPASAQLAVYDRTLPIGWAHRFVGVDAAAKLLAAHAEELARVGDVRPAAMVSSELAVQRPREWVGEFEAVRVADIRLSRGEVPTAGGGYRHRLEAVAPDIWAKTQRVLGEVMWRRVAEAVAQTVLDAAKVVEADRPPMSPPLVDPYDRREVVDRLGAGQPVDWDAHHEHVAKRGVLHPDTVLDPDHSKESELARTLYAHFYRAYLIVEMLRCWRDQPVSLPDVAYCGWAAGFGHVVDGALNQALAVLEPGQRR